MRLKEFVSLDDVEQSAGDLEREVLGLAYDSRKVQPGEVFFAVPGGTADGHRFIPDALRRGAAAIVFSREDCRPTAAASVRVRDVRRALGLWAAHFYRRPSARLRLVGVTGTNGKTTLTYLIESVLHVAGLRPGVIGTISYRFPGYEAPSHHTTPESLDLQGMLSEMVEAETRAVAMEVSSHALAQDRVRGLEFDIGVFTNLSRDHLDYHRDMDEYFLAKSRLFTEYLKDSPKPRKAAVIYGEDPRAIELMAKAGASGAEVWSYGEGRQWDVHPLEIASDVGGLRGRIEAKGELIAIESSLVGAANLQNILGAAAVGRALGLGIDVLAEGIRRLKSVPGRLERIANDRNLTILVDYAHSPDALEKVLGAVRPLSRGRVFTVFGCGGDRDRGKRPLMGEIAGRLSDLVVLTSDNPRTEEPAAILRDVEAGVKAAGLVRLDGPLCHSKAAVGRGYVVEPDRRKAIRTAIGLAIAGDLILIAGKGHETYQILGTNKIHFDDREVARAESRREADR